jgi:hypothetical protein
MMKQFGWPMRTYGLACYILGTVVSFTGLSLCSHVIEGSTTEYEFVPNPDKPDLVIITVQEDATLGEQHFPSFVSICTPNQPIIRASVLNNKDYR